MERLENKASDYGITTDGKYGSRIFGNAPGDKFARAKPLTAHACCEQNIPKYTNDGPASWAVDGITGHWWHAAYPSPTVEAEKQGYDIYTLTTGHVGDDGNFIRKGDSNRVNGWTWTKDPLLAVQKDGAPVSVGGVVPKQGAHWITLDFGEEVEFNASVVARLGYTRRSDSERNGGDLGAWANDAGNGASNSYEIFVSKKDFGWVVNDPDVQKISIATLNRYGDENDLTERISNATGNQYVFLDSSVYARGIKFRYLQLRWRFRDTETPSTNSRGASAENIQFVINHREGIDYGFVNAVYSTGMETLRGMRFDDPNYSILKIRMDAFLAPSNTYPAPFTNKSIFAYPTAEERDTLAKRLAIQDFLDSKADELLSVIYRVKPPKLGPEVEL
jgi:hypothetical protein